MVWNTTQSSLYRAVSDYNDEIERRERKPRQKEASHSQEYVSRTSRGRTNDGCDTRKRHDRPSNCGKKCEGCPYRSDHHDPPNADLTNGGMGFDGDLLLLAGLIFILLKNGADKKLIAALAIALIG